MNHYRHHLGDYAKDTAHLSLLEHGVYGQLMRRYYASEAQLPPDAGEVARLIGARSAPERAAVNNVLKDFFELREDGYHQKRIDAEIAEYKTKSDRNREVGKTGGRPKGNPDGFQKETQPVSNSNPEETLASSHKPVTSTKPPPEQAAPQVSATVAESPPLAALAALCSQSRVRTDGAKAALYLRQMVAEDVTMRELTDAIALARERKPDPEVIPLAYLAPILSDLRNGRVTRLEPRGQDAVAQAMANIAAKESANAPH